jgi:hypothetical protein
LAAGDQLQRCKGVLAAAAARKKNLLSSMMTAQKGLQIAGQAMVAGVERTVKL